MSNQEEQQRNLDKLSDHAEGDTRVDEAKASKVWPCVLLSIQLSSTDPTDNDYQQHQQRPPLSLYCTLHLIG
jgi:hypothetical protein